MKPPTEEQLNEEVDDGYGLHTRESPPGSSREPSTSSKAELDALEITAEMVTDRWRRRKSSSWSWSATTNSLEVRDGVDGRGGPGRRGQEQDQLQEAKGQLKRKGRVRGGEERSPRRPLTSKRARWP
jgi:hypothetical protein